MLASLLTPAPLQLFFFAALMLAVMLLFLWMARGYKYLPGAAAADAAADAAVDAAAAGSDSPHAPDDESSLLSSHEQQAQA